MLITKDMICIDADLKDKEKIIRAVAERMDRAGKLADQEGYIREVFKREGIKRVIAPLSDAYRKISDQNSAGPVMENPQTVYAGLTYGRNTLTENLADQGLNRGILA